MKTAPIPGLDERQNAQIQSVFAAAPGLGRAVLYGSRAMGRHRPNSDIDLVVEGDMDWRAAAHLADELEELPLPYEFDVQLLAGITHPALIAHIQRVGVEVFVRA